MPAAEPATERRRRLDTATAHLDPPFAVLDLGALRRNTADLRRRAAGTPIRVASKSVRCRAVLTSTLAQPGFAGVMAYCLAEAVWLADCGVDDVLVAYPSTDRTAARALTDGDDRRRSITIMVDDVRQLDALPHLDGVQVCLDVDASLRLGALHLGVRRSPVRTPRQAADLAARVTHRGATVRGLMFYEAQVAGLPDTGPAVRALKRRSLRELRDRRAAVVAAVRDVTDVQLVNGGGTGSVHVTRLDPTVTEVTAGSGLFGPALFDRYDDFSPEPAALVALPVTRRPARRIATCAGGGYVASGAPGRDRLPVPTLPAGLHLLRAEGAGEVQTPVGGRAAERLRIGDRVWFRHAKAGELCERFDELHLVDGDRVVDVVPTYRGEGRCFG